VVWEWSEDDGQTSGITEILSVPEEPRKVLRHYRAVRTLMENNLYFSVQSKGETERTSYLQEKFKVGRKYKTTEVRQNHGIVNNQMHADLFSVRKETPDVMTPEQPYKNSFRELSEIATKVAQAEEEGGEGKAAGVLYSEDDGKLQVWFGPKGGNPTKAGQFSQPLPTDKNKETTRRTEHATSIASNSGLYEDMNTNAVFHLFVPAQWATTTKKPEAVQGSTLNHGMKSNRDDYVIYLGLWYFHHCIIMERPGWCDPRDRNTEWLRANAPLWYCRPLYNSCHKPPPHLHDVERPLQELPITWDESIAVWANDVKQGHEDTTIQNALSEIQRDSQSIDENWSSIVEEGQEEGGINVAQDDRNNNSVPENGNGENNGLEVQDNRIQNAPSEIQWDSQPMDENWSSILVEEGQEEGGINHVAQDDWSEQEQCTREWQR
jgi:hypothetical protein